MPVVRKVKRDSESSLSQLGYVRATYLHSSLNALRTREGEFDGSSGIRGNSSPIILQDCFPPPPRSSLYKKIGVTFFFFSPLAHVVQPVYPVTRAATHDFASGKPCCPWQASRCARARLHTSLTCNPQSCIHYMCNTCSTCNHVTCLADSDFLPLGLAARVRY